MDKTINSLKRFHNIKYKKTIPYLIIILVAFFVIGDIFDKGILTNSDNIAHYLETVYLKENLLNEGKISGWYPNILAGIPLHIYTPILGYWIIVLLSIIPGISINLAYKIIILLSFAFPSISLYKLCKNYFGVLPSLLPTIMLLFQHEYQSFIITGMWSSGIAMGIAILLHYYLIKNYEKFNIKNSVITGIAIALIIISHLFIGISSTLSVILFFILKYIKEKNIKKNLMLLFIVGITSIIFSLFYILPIIETLDWPLKGTSYGMGDSIKDILITEIGMFLSLKHHQEPISEMLNGNVIENIIPLLKTIIFNIPMLIFDLFSIIGILLFIKSKKNSFMQNYTILTIIMLLIIGSGFWYIFPNIKNLPIFGTILTFRFVYMARLLLAVFAAYGITKFWKKHNKKSIALLTVLIILLILLFPANYKLNEKLTETTEETEVFLEAKEIFYWIKENVNPNKTRVFDQSTYVNILDGSIAKQNLIFALSPLYTDTHFLTSWVMIRYPTELYLKTESKYLFNKTIKEITKEEIVFYLEKYNAKYIITSESTLKNKIENSKKFEKKYSTKHFTIFELNDYAPTWLESEKPLYHKLDFVNNDNIELKINNKYQNNKATIKISYHDYWKAKIKESNSKIKLKQEKYGLIEADMPVGNYTVIIRFGEKLRKYEILQLILISIFLMIIFIKKTKI